MRKLFTNIINRPHLSILILVLFLTLGFLGRELALAWTAPTQAPPQGNVAPPLNTSDANQFKEGWLLVGDDLEKHPTGPAAALEVIGQVIASTTPLANNNLASKAYVDAAVSGGTTGSAGGGGGGPVLEWVQQPTITTGYIAKARWGPSDAGYNYDCYYRISTGPWIYQGDCFTDGIDLSSNQNSSLSVIAYDSSQIQGYIDSVWRKIGDYGWATDKIYDPQGSYYTLEAGLVKKNGSSGGSRWTDNTSLGSWSATDKPGCLETTTGICDGVSNCSCAPPCRKSPGSSCTQNAYNNPQHSTALGTYPLSYDYSSNVRYCIEEGNQGAYFCPYPNSIYDYVAKWNNGEWVKWQQSSPENKCTQAVCYDCSSGWYWANITIESYECESLPTLGTRLRVKDAGGYSNMLTYDVPAGVLCGNGVVEGDEDCDDGNSIDGDGCNVSANCQYVCGDGYVNAVAGEGCDDGNTVWDQGNCAADCSRINYWSAPTQGARMYSGPGDVCDPTIPTANDTRVSAGNNEFFCQLKGFQSTADYIPTSPVPAINRQASFYYSCFDLENDDKWVYEGCPGGCALIDQVWCQGVYSAECGNQIVDPGEDCDDGDERDGNGCNTFSSNCQYVCGDGYVNAGDGEQCDDANDVAGDGCFQCSFEELIVYTTWPNTHDGQFVGYGGAASGRAGADKYCQDNKPGSLSCGNIRALLNFYDSPGGIDTMPATYNYSQTRAIYWVNIAGTTFTKMANNWADMCDGTILATQNAAGASNYNAWTGSNSDTWSQNPTLACIAKGFNETCNNWSVKTGSTYKGTNGDGEVTNYQWLDDGTDNCSFGYILRCICQGNAG